MAFDAVGQVMSILHTITGQPVRDRFTYTYDSNSYKATIADLAGSMTTYTMDSKDRPTQDRHVGRQRPSLQLRLRPPGSCCQNCACSGGGDSGPALFVLGCTA